MRFYVSFWIVLDGFYQNYVGFNPIFLIYVGKFKDSMIKLAKQIVFWDTVAWRNSSWDLSEKVTMLKKNETTYTWSSFFSAFDN